MRSVKSSAERTGLTEESHKLQLKQERGNKHEILVDMSEEKVSRADE